MNANDGSVDIRRRGRLCERRQIAIEVQRAGPTRMRLRNRKYRMMGIRRYRESNQMQLHRRAATWQPAMRCGQSTSWTTMRVSGSTSITRLPE